MKLGEHLRRLREAAGHSAAEVYEALGVKKSTFYAWEGRDSRPLPEDLKRLLDFYGASVSERLLAYELRGQPSPVA